jgi:hypothetical protein
METAKVGGQVVDQTVTAGAAEQLNRFVVLARAAGLLPPTARSVMLSTC